MSSRVASLVKSRRFRGAAAGVAPLVVASAIGVSPAMAARRRAPTPEGADLIGQAALPLEASEWINSPPLEIAGLRGDVILIRWFTSPNCPYCTVSAPALNKLHYDFQAHGLVVIGMYHHKDDTPLTVDGVKASAEALGLTFPVAIDRDWRTLRRWWLAAGNRDFTSVSFLIDKKGVIRRIHRGGALALGSTDYRRMRATIERLIAEGGSPP